MDREYIFNEGSNKYYKVTLPKDITNYSNLNFEKLLIFIGTYRPYRNREPIGSAYMEIRKKTNELLQLDWKNFVMRTSKKEVASIRKYYKINSNAGNQLYVKIPFKIAYIFKAIDLIVQEIKADGTKIPNDLEQFINETYAAVFYEKHISAYDACFNSIPLEKSAQRALNGDFHNLDSSLNKIFK